MLGLATGRKLPLQVSTLMHGLRHRVAFTMVGPPEGPHPTAHEEWAEWLWGFVNYQDSELEPLPMEMEGLLPCSTRRRVTHGDSEPCPKRRRVTHGDSEPLPIEGPESLMGSPG